MNIAKQHKEFKIRLNKVDSNHDIDFKPNQIDSFLDNAAIFMIEHYGELKPFTKSQFSKDLFSTLLVKYPDQPELIPTSSTGQQYEFPLANLKYQYHHLDRAYVQCGTNVVPITMITHDEQDKLNDQFTKPNFLWKRLLGIIGKSSATSKSSLYVYSDVALGTTKKLRIEYVKYPTTVFFGGYDSIEYLDCLKRQNNNLPTEGCNQYKKKGDIPVNSELPTSYHDLQVDVAVWLATGKTENQLLNNFLNNKLINLPS